MLILWRSEEISLSSGIYGTPVIDKDMTLLEIKITKAMPMWLAQTLSENLDYTGVFDEILNEYTSEHKLTNVKTTNMGSLFKLTYDVVLKNLDKEKEFIDKLRTRNGNLEIAFSYKESKLEEL